MLLVANDLKVYHPVLHEGIFQIPGHLNDLRSKAILEFHF